MNNQHSSENRTTCGGRLVTALPIATLFVLAPTLAATNTALAQPSLSLDRDVVTPGTPVTATIDGEPDQYLALLGSSVGAGLAHAGVSLSVGADFAILAYGVVDRSGQAVVGVVPPFFFSVLDRYYIRTATSRSSPRTRTLQSRTPQTEGGATQQQSAGDRRGTNQSPFIVKIQPTPKTDEEATKEQAKEQDAASANRWTKGLGIATGILGLLQLIVIGFQARIAKRQNEIIEKQNTIMDGQRTAAVEQSAYMSDGLIETKKAADAAAKSVEHAERQMKLLNQQWLDTDEWRIEDRRASYGLPNYRVIVFSIVNPTPMAVEITGLSIDDESGLRDPIKSSVTNMLPPQHRMRIDHVPCRRLDSREAVGEWYASGTIRGTIYFTDAFGEKREQRFGRNYKGVDTFNKKEQMFSILDSLGFIHWEHPKPKNDGKDGQRESQP
jgi:hypothetical protein